MSNFYNYSKLINIFSIFLINKYLKYNLFDIKLLITEIIIKPQNKKNFTKYYQNYIL